MLKGKSKFIRGESVIEQEAVKAYSSKHLTLNQKFKDDLNLFLKDLIKISESFTRYKAKIASRSEHSQENLFERFKPKQYKNIIFTRLLGEFEFVNDEKINQNFFCLFLDSLQKKHLKAHEAKNNFHESESEHSNYNNHNCKDTKFFYTDDNKENINITNIDFKKTKSFITQHKQQPNQIKNYRNLSKNFSLEKSENKQSKEKKKLFAYSNLILSHSLKNYAEDLNAKDANITEDSQLIDFKNFCFEFYRTDLMLIYSAHDNFIIKNILGALVKTYFLTIFGELKKRIKVNTEDFLNYENPIFSQYSDFEILCDFIKNETIDVKVFGENLKYMLGVNANDAKKTSLFLHSSIKVFAEIFLSVAKTKILKFLNTKVYITNNTLQEFDNLKINFIGRLKKLLTESANVLYDFMAFKLKEFNTDLKKAFRSIGKIWLKEANIVKAAQTKKRKKFGFINYNNPNYLENNKLLLSGDAWSKCRNNIFAKNFKFSDDIDYNNENSIRKTFKENDNFSLSKNGNTPYVIRISRQLKDSRISKKSVSDMRKILIKHEIGKINDNFFLNVSRLNFLKLKELKFPAIYNKKKANESIPFIENYKYNKCLNYEKNAYYILLKTAKLINSLNYYEQNNYVVNKNSLSQARNKIIHDARKMLMNKFKEEFFLNYFLLIKTAIKNSLMIKELTNQQYTWVLFEPIKAGKKFELDGDKNLNKLDNEKNKDSYLIINETNKNPKINFYKHWINSSVKKTLKIFNRNINNAFSYRIENENVFKKFKNPFRLDSGSVQIKNFGLLFRNMRNQIYSNLDRKISINTHLPLDHANIKKKTESNINNQNKNKDSQDDNILKHFLSDNIVDKKFILRNF